MYVLSHSIIRFNVSLTASDLEELQKGHLIINSDDHYQIEIRYKEDGQS